MGVCGFSARRTVIQNGLRISIAGKALLNRALNNMHYGGACYSNNCAPTKSCHDQLSPLRRNQRAICQASVLALFLVGLIGCADSDEMYDRGYGDGNAVGYNLACATGASNVIWDRFDNEQYARGCADGMEDGIRECLAGDPP